MRRGINGSQPAGRDRELLWSAVVFALAGLMIAPTFFWGLPCGHDANAHYYRISQIILNGQNGNPFWLWSPDLLRGYGYPILGLYAPLSYWLTAAITPLTGSLTLSIRLFLWFSLFMSGWGAFHLGRRYMGRGGAFVTGVGMMFAPYILYDATTRAAYAELLGLAFLPWVIAAFDRLQHEPGRRNFGRAVFWLFLLILSHNVLPFIAVFFVGLLWVFNGRTRGSNFRSWLSYLGPTLAAGLLAVGITSFFWLPALVELGVTHSRVTDGPTLHSWSYFGRHFIPWSDMVRWAAEPGDPALANPPFMVTLGFGLGVMAFTGAIVRVLGGPRRWDFLFWLLTCVACLFLSNNISAWFWENLPLPRYIQLPSRLFGPASLAAAVLAGGAVDWLILKTKSFKSRLPAAAFLLGGAALVSVSGWPWLFPPSYCPFPENITPLVVADATRWMEDGAVLEWGGAASGETLPKWTTQLPPADAIVVQYEADEIPQRLVVPGEVQIISWKRTTRGFSYRLNAAEPARLTFQMLFFPGWRVEINGTQRPVETTQPYGFLTFTVPAGSLDVEIEFRPTPLRIWSAIFSFVLIIGLSVFLWGWFPRLAAGQLARKKPALIVSRRLIFAVLSLLVIGRLVVNFLDTPVRADRLVDGQLVGISTPTYIPFEGEFIHLGFSAPARVSRDRPFEVVQYWRPQQDIGVLYGFGMRVTDDQGNVWSRQEEPPFGTVGPPGYGGWRPDRYARDPYSLTLLPGIPPGEYWLEAEVFQRQRSYSLVPAANRSVDPQFARLGKIQVVAGRWEQTANWRIDNVIDRPFTGDLNLHGWSIGNPVWQVGKPTRVDLLWSLSKSGKQDLAGALQLRQKNGEIVLEKPFNLGATYPTSFWRPGQRVRNQVRWQIPAAVPGGKYDVVVVVGDDDEILDQITVEAPARVFDLPDPEVSLTAEIGPARLLGYDLDETDAEHTALRLYWQALAENSTSFRVFVHVRDESGAIVTQSDGIPAEWTRPTTGWVPGEIISDLHRLQVPVSALVDGLTIHVGFYNAITGERRGETTISPAR